MSNQNEEKVTKAEQKKKKSLLRWQIKTILFCVAITICCCIATSYVTEKKCIENPYKARIDIETMPCGLPLEMQYIDRIESGIYVSASYYGMCLLDIKVNENRESAEVYIAFYPGNIDVYGYPSYRRYICMIDRKGNLVESEGTDFILTFDPGDRQIDFNIIDERSFSFKIGGIEENLVATPFTCIWLDSTELEDIKI